MRIISKGTKKPPVYRGTCDKCGCVFEEDADKLIITHDQREFTSFAHVFCPQCNTAAIMYPVKNS